MKLYGGLIVAALALAGCGLDSKTPPPEPVKSDQPPPILANDLMLRENSDVLTFSWSMAPEAALEPRLFRALKADVHTLLKDQQLQAQSAAAEARASQFPVRPFDYQERWAPESETSGLLVLSGEAYTYTGGAHGMTVHKVVIWDRRAKARIPFTGLFSDGTAAIEALKPGWCSALDAKRRERRGGVDLEGFNDCPELSEQALVPVGSPKIAALKVIAGPYAAGPYSEGSYEVMLDLSPVRAMVAPAFDDDFQ